MSQYRNVSGERRAVAVLGGRWVEPDEVVTVPDSLAEPHLVWPDVTWERIDAERAEGPDPEPTEGEEA